MIFQSYISSTTPAFAHFLFTGIGIGGSMFSQTSGAQDIILKILFALTDICLMNIMACVVEMIGLGFIVAKPAIISIDV